MPQEIKNDGIGIPCAANLLGIGQHAAMLNDLYLAAGIFKPLFWLRRKDAKRSGKRNDFEGGILHFQGSSS